MHVVEWWMWWTRGRKRCERRRESMEAKSRGDDVVAADGGSAVMAVVARGLAPLSNRRQLLMQRQRQTWCEDGDEEH